MGITGDNDPARRWIPIEASSAFEAAIYYWGAVAALMAGPNIPRPTPETIFQVRIGGRPGVEQFCSPAILLMPPRQSR